MPLEPLDGGAFGVHHGARQLPPQPSRRHRATALPRRPHQSDPEPAGRRAVAVWLILRQWLAPLPSPRRSLKLWFAACQVCRKASVLWAWRGSGAHKTLLQQLLFVTQ
jgi:hypothetical protein